MMLMYRKLTLTIRVIPRVLPEGEKVYITGNHQLLGSWRPDAIVLEKQVDGSWSRQFIFRKNTRLEYKITRGSWKTEAAGESGAVLWNHHLKINKNDVQTINISNWRDLALSRNGNNGEDADTAPGKRITGAVQFHRQVEAKGLQPRDIIVWLPPGYEKEPQKRYPVLYLHDGQNMFDPVTSFTGVDWQADETATRLIENGDIREIIMVGIYNTDERLEEYSASPTGKLYRQFVSEQLKPFIDQIYRTLPEREYTATIGSSLGGLAAFLLVWEHSEVFSMAGCLSPSFIFRKNQAIKSLKKSAPPQLSVRICMDCGGVGGEKLLYKGCKKVLKILHRKGIVAGEDFQFAFYKRANHSETAWGERLWRHLMFMFGNNDR
jgi:predicted alpha/beta superfamily hydrolase